MPLARAVFWLAGLLGIAAIAPLYVLEARFGAAYPPPLNHPEFFYGFAGAALAWQLAFLLIGSSPSRYRPLMLAAVAEKFAYSIAIFGLAWQNRIPSPIVLSGVLDFALGIAFVFAWLRTPKHQPLATVKPYEVHTP